MSPFRRPGAESACSLGAHESRRRCLGRRAGPAGRVRRDLPAGRHAAGHGDRAGKHGDLGGEPDSLWQPGDRLGLARLRPRRRPHRGGCRDGDASRDPGHREGAARRRGVRLADRRRHDRRRDRERHRLRPRPATRPECGRRHLGTPVRRSPSAPCGNIDPLGITGTPVYDTATGVVFVVAELRPRRSATSWSRSTLRPARCAGGVSSTCPASTPRRMQERGALTIAGGRVWVPFGGLAGDCGDYKGRVVGVPLTGRARRWSPTPCRPRREGGHLDAARARRSTPPAHLFVAVGNGASDPGEPYDHSDSIARDRPGARLARLVLADHLAHRQRRRPRPRLAGPGARRHRGCSSPASPAPAYVLRAGAPRRHRRPGQPGAVCRSFGGTAVDGDDRLRARAPTASRAVRIDAAGRMHVLWHAAGRSPARPSSAAAGCGRSTLTRACCTPRPGHRARCWRQVAVGAVEPLRDARPCPARDRARARPLDRAHRRRAS